MTARLELWLIRLASIPVLLYFPFACIGLAGLIVGWPKGDNFPTAGFLGMFMALATAVPLARSTVFARADQLARAKKVLLGLVMFDIGIMALGHLQRYLSHAA